MAGGSKPGERRGGRQKGTPNRLTVERDIRAANGLEAAHTGLLPLDVMLARMRDEPMPNGCKPTDEQFQAAVAAAPYIHPRLAATAIKATIETSPPAPIDSRQLTAHQGEVFHEILLLAHSRAPESL